MKNSFRTDLAKVKGLGSAKSGAHHWWHQRLTAMILTAMSLWVIYFIKTAVLSEDQTSLIKYIQKPYNIIFSSVFVITTFYHSMLGLRVVIEDYISCTTTRTFLIVFTQIFCISTVATFEVALFSLMILQG